ncbi:hypothetical protein SAMN05216378_4004 [Paenibacillus catalpae]|uniref:Uncharacterized protein n=1 Tax=Paenibacillus catalpae TaxID=1045775 RepID=A0A1I2D890_9BACL|nr:hypothetical protein [Paenibacillus catalpae]SFE76735.1 hypothetical protein SAMN05216378_4004 [Paenibacillus catalpae]
MELQPFKHTVRNPSGMKNIFAMTVLCSLFLISELRANEDNTVLHVLGIVFFCLCAGVLLWSLFRAMKKPIDLSLQDDAILLNGRAITAEQIEVIMIRRDSVHPIIGIKPRGARIVPIRMCFRYVDKEERGIADIAEWAGKNNVKVDYSFFFRWI